MSEISKHRTGSSWSTDEWDDWVHKRLKKRFATFTNEPGEMIAAYERERNNIDDYRGRELLELLQNADDAGVDFGPNKAIISYRPEGIIVGNTGIPFSAAGVESLLISNLSPKKLDRSRYIGNRGLGFRSILGWTENPFIFSGNLRLVFSSSLADSMLNLLISENSDVKERVDEWRASGHHAPIPTLACPAILDHQGMASGFEPSVSFQKMWSYVQELREEYDTIVAIPFTESSAPTRVYQQIESIREELLLFLKHIEELTIEDEDSTKSWRAQRTEKSVRIFLSEEKSLEWKIFRREGIVPEEILEPGQRNTPAFEIQIAIPEELVVSNTLVSYFPTKVRFPYPVIAHITMELTSNRQNLVESEANRFLAQQLARALADVAELSVRKDDPWFALRLVTSSTRSLDPILESFEFHETLVESAIQKQIIPMSERDFGIASSATRLSVDNRGWLPSEAFVDLVLWTDDYQMKQALDRFNITIISNDEFNSRLKTISPKLSMKQRIDLLIGLLKHKNIFASEEPPPILIDQDDKLIESKTTVYFPPTSAEITFEPPSWMSLRFLSEELVDGLLGEEGGSRERHAENLRDLGFRGVHPYDFRGVARALLTLTSKKCNDNPEDENNLRLDCINSLFRMFIAAGSRDVLKRDIDINVPVLTRAGEWKNASQLYLGVPYPKGHLLEALLGNLQPDLFVAKPADYGTEYSLLQLEDFLRWLGVAIIPREERITIYSWYGDDIHKNYLEYARMTANYPINFGDFKAHVPDQLKITRMEVTGITFLLDMLHNVDPHVILSWVAIDPRFDGWNRIGDTQIKMQACFRVQTHREIQGYALPSYIMWILKNEAWMPITDKSHRSPNVCVSVRLSGQELQRIFPRPDIDLNSELFKRLSLGRAEINLALIRLGVRMTLDDLSWGQCYELLLSLPDIDPEGKAATRIYKIVLEKREDEILSTAANEMRNKFLERGLLWCYLNGTGEYLPVSDGIFFSADSAVPQAIVNSMPTLDLPRGRGSEKIERLLGAKAIRSQEILLEIISVQKIAYGNILNDQLERLKPYILALRLDSTPDVSGLGRFKRLKVIPCSRIEGKAEVHGQLLSFLLDADGALLISEDNAYLIMPSNNSYSRLENPIIARYVANALSSILQVERSSDFAQLAICQDQQSRKKLLSEIIGHDANDIIARAFNELRITEETEILETTKVDLETESINPAVQATKLDDNETELEEDVDKSELSKDGQSSPLPTSVYSFPVDQEPAAPKKKVASRVRVTQSTGSGIRHGYRITDGNRCEELAKKFEVSQGRYPLRVGGIEGYEGFGCDILSFATESDRKEFVESKGTKIQKVLRFIEVKGRSSSNGSISLQGNELNAARIRKERYFLYRVYEEIAGKKWQVVELCHPLSFEWEESYAVDPFRCPATSYWSVEPSDEYDSDGT